MMNKLSLIAAALVSVLAGSAQAANLHPNGTFDKGLDGWVTDYAWSGNSHYMGNASLVSVVPAEAGKKNVAYMKAVKEAGTKMESFLIPFDPNARYTATFDVKGKAVRAYFAGYRFAPGVRPSDNPQVSDMRMIYRGKNETHSQDSWKKMTVEIPGKNLSDAALKHLKDVRYISLYIWCKKDTYVDNVVITKN